VSKKEKACKKLPNTATKMDRAEAHKEKMSLKKIRREVLTRDYEAMVAKNKPIPIKPNLSKRHPNTNKPVQEAYK